MDYCDAQTIEMTAKSYVEAVRKIEKYCPQLSLFHHNGGTSEALKQDLKPDWSCHSKGAMAEATSVIVSRAELFDYGRPILPSRMGWARDTDFFRVYFTISVPFTEYGWDRARSASHGEDGEIISPAVPAHIVERQSHISFDFDGRKWGLNDWYVKAGEIRNYCDQCGADVRDAYAKAYSAACEEVTKWEAAMKELATASIPR